MGDHLSELRALAIASMIGTKRPAVASAEDREEGELSPEEDRRVVLKSSKRSRVERISKDWLAVEKAVRSSTRERGALGESEDLRERAREARSGLQLMEKHIQETADDVKVVRSDYIETEKGNVNGAPVSNTQGESQEAVDAASKIDILASVLTHKKEGIEETCVSAEEGEQLSRQSLDGIPERPQVAVPVNCADVRMSINQADSRKGHVMLPDTTRVEGLHSQPEEPQCRFNVSEELNNLGSSVVVEVAKDFGGTDPCPAPPDIVRKSTTARGVVTEQGLSNLNEGSSSFTTAPELPCRLSPLPPPPIHSQKGKPATNDSSSIMGQVCAPVPVRLGGVGSMLEAVSVPAINRAPSATDMSVRKEAELFLRDLGKSLGGAAKRRRGAPSDDSFLITFDDDDEEEDNRLETEAPTPLGGVVAAPSSNSQPGQQSVGLHAEIERMRKQIAAMQKVNGKGSVSAARSLDQQGGRPVSPIVPGTDNGTSAAHVGKVGGRGTGGRPAVGNGHANQSIADLEELKKRIHAKEAEVLQLRQVSVKGTLNDVEVQKQGPKRGVESDTSTGPRFRVLPPHVRSSGAPDNRAGQLHSANASKRDNVHPSTSTAGRTLNQCSIPSLAILPVGPAITPVAAPTSIPHAAGAISIKAPASSQPAMIKSSAESEKQVDNLRGRVMGRVSKSTKEPRADGGDGGHKQLATEYLPPTNGVPTAAHQHTVEKDSESRGTLSQGTKEQEFRADKGIREELPLVTANAKGSRGTSESKTLQLELGGLTEHPPIQALPDERIEERRVVREFASDKGAPPSVNIPEERAMGTQEGREMAGGLAPRAGAEVDLVLATTRTLPPNTLLPPGSRTANNPPPNGHPPLNGPSDLSQRPSNAVSGLQAEKGMFLNRVRAAEQMVDTFRVASSVPFCNVPLVTEGRTTTEAASRRMTEDFVEGTQQPHMEPPRPELPWPTFPKIGWGSPHIASDEAYVQRLRHDEEAIEEALEEAQQERRRLEVRERMARRALRETEAALQAASARCASLAQRREALSVSLHTAQMMQAARGPPQSGPTVLSTFSSPALGVSFHPPPSDTEQPVYLEKASVQLHSASHPMWPQPTLHPPEPPGPVSEGANLSLQTVDETLAARLEDRLPESTRDGLEKQSEFEVRERGERPQESHPRDISAKETNGKMVMAHRAVSRVDGGDHGNWAARSSVQHHSAVFPVSPAVSSVQPVSAIAEQASASKPHEPVRQDTEKLGLLQSANALNRDSGLEIAIVPKDVECGEPDRQGESLKGLSDDQRKLGGRAAVAVTRGLESNALQKAGGEITSQERESVNLASFTHQVSSSARQQVVPSLKRQIVRQGDGPKKRKARRKSSEQVKHAEAYKSSVAKVDEADEVARLKDEQEKIAQIARDIRARLLREFGSKPQGHSDEALRLGRVTPLPPGPSCDGQKFPLDSSVQVPRNVARKENPPLPLHLVSREERGETDVASKASNEKAINSNLGEEPHSVIETTTGAEKGSAGQSEQVMLRAHLKHLGRSKPSEAQEPATNVGNNLQTSAVSLITIQDSHRQENETPNITERLEVGQAETGETREKPGEIEEILLQGRLGEPASPTPLHQSDSPVCGSLSVPVLGHCLETAANDSGVEGFTVLSEDETGKEREGQNTTQSAAFQTRYHSPLACLRSFRLSSRFATIWGHSPASPTWRNVIDPHKILCKFEHRGRCNDKKCPWQHIAQYMDKEEVTCDFSMDISSNGCSQLNWWLRRASQNIQAVDKVVLHPEAAMVENHLGGSEVSVPPYYIATAEAGLGFAGGQGEGAASKELQLFFSPMRRGLPAEVQVLSSTVNCNDGSFLPSVENCDKEVDEGVRPRYFKDGSKLLKQAEARVQQEPESVEGWLDLALFHTSYSLDSNLHKDARDEALRVLVRALEANRRSATLWSVYLLLYRSRTNGPEDYYNIVMSAIEYNMGSYEVWRLLLHSLPSVQQQLRSCQQALDTLPCSPCSHAIPSELLSAQILDFALRFLHFNCTAGHASGAIDWLQKLKTALNDYKEESMEGEASRLPGFGVWVTCLSGPDLAVLCVAAACVCVQQQLPHAVVDRLGYYQAQPLPLDVDWRAWDSASKELKEETKGLCLDILRMGMRVAQSKGGIPASEWNDCLPEGMTPSAALGVNLVQAMAALKGKAAAAAESAGLLAEHSQCLELLHLHANLVSCTDPSDFRAAKVVWEAALKGSLQGGHCILRLFWHYAQQAFFNVGSQAAQDILATAAGLQSEVAHDVAEVRVALAAVVASKSDMLERTYGLLCLAMLEALQGKAAAALEHAESSLEAAIDAGLSHIQQTLTEIGSLVQAGLHVATGNQPASHAEMKLRLLSRLLDSLLRNPKTRAKVFRPVKQLAQLLQDVQKPRLVQVLASLFGGPRVDFSCAEALLGAAEDGSREQRVVTPIDLKAEVRLAEGIMELMPSNTAAAWRIAEQMERRKFPSKAAAMACLWWTTSLLVGTLVEAEKAKRIDGLEGVWLSAGLRLEQQLQLPKAALQLYSLAAKLYPQSLALKDRLSTLQQRTKDVDATLVEERTT